MKLMQSHIPVTAFIMAFAAVSIFACGESKDYGEIAADSIEQMQEAVHPDATRPPESVLSYWFNIGADTMHTGEQKRIILQGAETEYTFIVQGMADISVPAADTVIVVDMSGWETGSYEYRTETDIGEVDRGIIVVD